MYKLIIIDDENFVREQLSIAVEWSTLGFELLATFQDGKDAWEYINENTVDVVLSDIEMPIMSGIELSKLVYENFPNIIMVLISSYKEFEYARKALKYNVHNYLLKPTTYQELNDTFLKIKSVLDTNHKKNSVTNEELLTIMRHQLLSDILVGALANKFSIQQRLNSAQLEIDLDNDPCCIVKIHLNDFEKYINNDWVHGKDRFYDALSHFIEANTQKSHFFVISFNHHNVQVIAIGKGITQNELYEDVIDFFDIAEKNIQETLQISINVTIGNVVPNILALINFSAKNESTNLVLDAQQLRSICSYIHVGNIEAVSNVITSVFDIINGDVNTARLFTVNLFSAISIMLIDLDKNPKDFISSDIKEAEEFALIFDLAMRTSQNVALHFSENPSAHYITIIDKSFSYIKAHCAEEISLNDVAEYVALSPVYFSRYFKQQTGEKFIDYLCRIRIEKAAELLCNPEYRVYEVCNLVGYSSTQHFYKLFRLYTGFTPTEYRNNLLRNGDIDADK